MNNTYTLTREQLEALLEDAISTAFDWTIKTDDPIKNAIDKTMLALDTECNCVTETQHCPACELSGRIASRTIAGSARYIGEKVEW